MNKKHIFFILLFTIGKLFCESNILENEPSPVKQELSMAEKQIYINHALENLHSQEHLLLNIAGTAALCATTGLVMEYMIPKNPNIDVSKKLAIYGLTCIGIASIAAIRDIHLSYDLKEQQKMLANAIAKESKHILPISNLSCL